MNTRERLMASLVLITSCVFIPTHSLAEIQAINIIGNEITLSGVGFGDKTPAAPILWEQFENGSSGSSLTSDSKWIAYSVDGGWYSDADSYSGSISAYNRVVGENHPDLTVNNNFNTSNFYFEPTDKVYYSSVFKYKFGDTEVENTYQVKAGRINASPNKYNGAGVMAHSNIGLYSDGTNGSGSVTLCWTATDCTIGNGHYHSGLQYDTWTRDELYKRESAPGVSDGYAFAYLGGSMSEVVYDNQMTRSAGETFQMDNIILGIMGANPGPNADVRIYVDDVYVDNTQARLELCPGSNWKNRGQCDIQIPSAWSNSSITATVNTGRFNNGDTAYLFVIDKDGNISNDANGFRVEIDGQSLKMPSVNDGDNLEPPGNLRIQKE